MDTTRAREVIALRAALGSPEDYARRVVDALLAELAGGTTAQDKADYAELLASREQVIAVAPSFVAEQFSVLDAMVVEARNVLAAAEQAGRSDPTTTAPDVEDDARRLADAVVATQTATDIETLAAELEDLHPGARDELVGLLGYIRDQPEQIEVVLDLLDETWRGRFAAMGAEPTAVAEAVQRILSGVGAAFPTLYLRRASALLDRAYALVTSPDCSGPRRAEAVAAYAEAADSFRAARAMLEKNPRDAIGRRRIKLAMDRVALAAAKAARACAGGPDRVRRVGPASVPEGAAQPLPDPQDGAFLTTPKLVTLDGTQARLGVEALQALGALGLQVVPVAAGYALAVPLPDATTVTFPAVELGQSVVVTVTGPGATRFLGALVALRASGAIDLQTPTMATVHTMLGDAMDVGLVVQILAPVWVDRFGVLLGGLLAGHPTVQGEVTTLRLGGATPAVTGRVNLQFLARDADSVELRIAIGGEVAMRRVVEGPRRSVLDPEAVILGLTPDYLAVVQENSLSGEAAAEAIRAAQRTDLSADEEAYTLRTIKSTIEASIAPALDRGSFPEVTFA